MTTSGTYDHGVTATDIITDALYKCGAMQEGEAVPPEQLTTGFRALNNLVKFLSTKPGRNLWRKEEVVVFLDKSQPRYKLGPSNTDAEWCRAEAFTSTKLNGAASAAATSLTVDSTADMRAADRLGLELSDGTREWLSITSVDSLTTITVPAISGAASDNATVYTYTTNTNEVVKVQTLVNGALGAGVTTIVTDSTTGMADGDRFSYVDTADNTVFSKITTVASTTNLTVPTTAAAIADDAVLKVYTTTVNQKAITTALNGAVLANAETIVVDDTAGMKAGDVLAVALTDASTEWVAIEHVVSGTVLAIPPISGAASDDGVVTAYTIKPPRPLRILHARRKSSPDGVDVQIDIEAQELYRDQPLKTGSGTPVFLTYKPELTSGIMEIWQPPNSIQMYLSLTVERPFEDFDAAANAPDFPQEWYDPLVYLLAQRIEPEYRLLDPTRLAYLRQDAKEMWDWVSEFDDDTGSIYFQPEFDGTGGYHS